MSSSSRVPTFDNFQHLSTMLHPMQNFQLCIFFVFNLALSTLFYGSLVAATLGGTSCKIFHLLVALVATTPDPGASSSPEQGGGLASHRALASLLPNGNMERRRVGFIARVVALVILIHAHTDVYIYIHIDHDSISSSSHVLWAHFGLIF